MENKTVLSVTRRDFQEDAQYKGLTLTQLKEKSSVPFQCATSPQLLFSKGTCRGKQR